MSWLYVGLGGGLGALLRHGVYTAASAGGLSGFWATLAVNAAGSLAMGYCLALWPPAQHPMRSFWMVGILGGFTTFSTFSADVWHWVQQGRWGWAGVYVLASVSAGLLCIWLGWLGGQSFLK